MGFGPWEIFLLLLILAVVFGAGRLSEVGGALGKSVRAFRSASNHPPAVPPAPAPPPVVVAQPAPETTPCPACGTPNPVSQAFCGQCGTRLSHVAA